MAIIEKNAISQSFLVGCYQLADLIHQHPMCLAILYAQVSHGDRRTGVVIPLAYDLKFGTVHGALNVSPSLSQRMRPVIAFQVYSPRPLFYQLTDGLALRKKGLNSELN